MTVAWLPAVLLTGCSEEPSFYLRWALTDDPALVYDAEDGDVPPLDSSLTCSESGIQRVRVNLYPEDAVFAEQFVRPGEPLESIDQWTEADDKKIYPCYLPEFDDPDGLIGGPELSPGTYVPHVIAVRRDGSPWPCDGSVLGDDWEDPDAPDEPDEPDETDTDGSTEPDCEGVGDSTCPPGYSRSDLKECYAVCVRNCQVGFQEDLEGECVACPGHTIGEAFTVKEDGEAPELGSFTLLAPRQCVDGVDNDGDGRTDAADPACQFDPFLNEDQDSGITLFALSISLLDNPKATCLKLGIDHIDAKVALEGGDEIELGEIPCQPSIPVFTEAIIPGTHTLVTTGIGFDDLPVTIAKSSEPFVISETEPSYVQETISFLGEDFLEPIVSDIDVVIYFYSNDEDDSGWSCFPPANEQGALLTGVETVGLQIRDENDQIMTAAELGIDGAVDGDPGVTLDPCPVAPVKTVDLTWGRYTLEAQGNVGDVTCFATSTPIELVPNASEGIFLDRIVDEDGVPPEGCWDCDDNDDCPGTYECFDHLCKDAGGQATTTVLSLDSASGAPNAE